MSCQVKNALKCIKANGLTSYAIHVRQRHQSRRTAEGWSEKKGRRIRFAMIFQIREFLLKRSVLINIFLRSLTIQASFNFKRMQNLGFAFTIVPLLRKYDPQRIVDTLIGHLQMFNTHPYLTAAVIGSVVRLEEDGDKLEADHLKKAVMGPYAAIGDSFFWGALRLFSALGAVIFAYLGFLLAPLMFLLLYNPSHVWVRVRGFFEGYYQGRQSINFLRGLDLPGLTGRIRILSLALTGVLAAVVVEMAYRPLDSLPEIPAKVAALTLILVCFLGIHRGMSTLMILYGMTFMCMVLSI
jgi:PTS system mannose-specific IID component